MLFDRAGALAVSISSSLSLVSTLSLGCFITFLSFRYKGIATIDTPSTSGIRFLRTQAGQLFINLLAADFVQALGFGLTWTWYGQSGIAESAKICLFQGISIEAGDVASALFSLLIALHTAGFLAFQYRPPNWVVRVTCAAAWVFTALLTAIGPLAIEKQAKGDFYASAGNWCWIAKPYEDLRLWLHYFFIFASAVGQLIAYCAIFIVLRFRLPVKPRLTHRELMKLAHAPTPSASTTKLVSTPGSSPSRSYRASTYTPPVYQGPNVPPAVGRPTTSASTLRRKIDKTCLVMLAYPLVNLTVILPLSIYRLSALAGRPGGPKSLAACGFIFALGGFANVLLYSFTRKLLRFPSNGSPRFGDVEKNYSATPLTIVTEKRPSPFAPSSPGSDATKVDSVPSSPFGTVFPKLPSAPSAAASKLKELRLSPSPPSSSHGRGVIRPAAPGQEAAVTLLPSASIKGQKGSLSRANTPIRDLGREVNISRETVTKVEN